MVIHKRITGLFDKSLDMLCGAKDGKFTNNWDRVTCPDCLKMNKN